MELIRPRGWREGQTIFNFLEWLNVKKGIHTNQNSRMADPFHVSDEDWDKFYEEFLKEHGLPIKVEKGKVSIRGVRTKK